MVQTYSWEPLDGYPTKESIAKRAPIFSKQLYVLLWLIIPTVVAGIMSQNYVMSVAPGIYTLGAVLGMVCSVVYGVILLQLSSQEEGYRTAGIFRLIFSATSFIAAIISFDGLLLIFLRIIIDLVSEYHEYKTHSLILTGIDDFLSEKWKTLWKFYIGLMLVMFGCVIVCFVSYTLGSIVLLGPVVGSIIVSIIKYIYIYQTATVFREYSENHFEEAL